MTATVDISRLLDLWSEPLPDNRDAEDAFRELYTDPVLVNGNPITAAEMVVRARDLQAMLSDVRREVLDVAYADGKVAVAFRLTGTQVGPMRTAAGILPPTGRQLSIRVIDILTVTGGRISSLVMVADELGALAALGAVSLAG